MKAFTMSTTSGTPAEASASTSPGKGRRATAEGEAHRIDIQDRLIGTAGPVRRLSATERHSRQDDAKILGEHVP
jgi:hypothetical protein